MSYTLNNRLLKFFMFLSCTGPVLHFDDMTDFGLLTAVSLPYVKYTRHDVMLEWSREVVQQVDTRQFTKPWYFIWDVKDLLKAPRTSQEADSYFASTVVILGVLVNVDMTAIACPWYVARFAWSLKLSLHLKRCNYILYICYQSNDKKLTSNFISLQFHRGLMIFNRARASSS